MGLLRLRCEEREVRHVKVFSGDIGTPVPAILRSRTARAKIEVPQAQPSTEYKIPAEAVQRVNPTKPTPESIAKGKKLYGYDCAMCHGENGDGKGDLAKDMKPAVPDFRDPAVLRARTDGELFYIMKNGKGEMPPENRGSDNALWDLVNYIRSLVNKKPSSEPGGTAPATH
jgi:mono/diheme cytochrome c family protein